MTKNDKRKQFPSLILISGSGPQDRDSSLAKHKPFLVIADYLARKGVNVISYDERGVGNSEGYYASANYNVLQSDIEDVLEYT